MGEPFVDADDIAEVAVAALTEEGHDGQLYEVTGPRLLTFSQAVNEISQATGRPVRFVPVSAEHLRAALTEKAGPEVAALPRVVLIASGLVATGIGGAILLVPAGFHATSGIDLGTNLSLLSVAVDGWPAGGLVVAALVELALGMACALALGRALPALGFPRKKVYT